MPELQHEDCPSFDLLEWDTQPMDSPDFSPPAVDTPGAVRWRSQLLRLRRLRDPAWHGHAGLHRQSALSFMLEHLNKTVILTGSMIPLAAPVSDAKRNVHHKPPLRSQPGHPRGVCVLQQPAAEGLPQRASWTRSRVNAFDSPNYPPLATMGTSILVNRALIRLRTLDAASPSPPAYTPPSPASS